MSWKRATWRGFPPRSFWRPAERAFVDPSRCIPFARRQTIEPVHLSFVYADQVQLDQVLRNLSLNARDAMPGGGRLFVETREEVLDEEGVADRPQMKSGRYVLLAVSDTGAGMTEEVRERAFPPCPPGGASGPTHRGGS